MAKLVMSLTENIVIRRSPAEIFDMAEAAADKANRLSSVVQVERLAGNGSPAVGHKWRISGDTRLGHRSGTVEIMGLARPERMSFRGEGRGFRADTTVVLEMVDQGRCRLTTTSEIFALTLAARLLAPGLRLWRRRAQKGLKKGLKRLKKRLEAGPA